MMARSDLVGKLGLVLLVRRHKKAPIREPVKGYKDINELMNYLVLRRAQVRGPSGGEAISMRIYAAGGYVFESGMPYGKRVTWSAAT